MTVQANMYKKGEMRTFAPTLAQIGGTPLQVRDLAGVNPTAIVAATDGEFRIVNDHKIVKDSTVFVQDEPVYWDNNGSPVGGVALSGAATSNPTLGDFLLGSCAKAAATADTHVIARLNEFSPLWPPFADKVHEVINNDLTIDIEDSDKVIRQTVDAKVVTLPAMAAGFAGIEFTIMCGAADGAIWTKVAPNASDKIIGPNMAGVDNKYYANTKATSKKGDYVTLRGDGTNGWFIVGRKGIWLSE